MSCTVASLNVVKNNYHQRANKLPILFVACTSFEAWTLGYEAFSLVLRCGNSVPPKNEMTPTHRVS